jgi:predicted aspartyl protease
LSFRFNPQHRLILVTARIWGPSGDTYATLALDTGSSATVIREAKLEFIGYHPAATVRRIQITTGSGVETVAQVVIDKIDVLDSERVGFRVLCHTLPPTAPVDGLLGLDFLRDQALTIDFRTGFITLT